MTFDDDDETRTRKELREIRERNPSYWEIIFWDNKAKSWLS